MVDAVNVEIPLPQIEDQNKFVAESGQLKEAEAMAKHRLDKKAAQLKQLWER